MTNLSYLLFLIRIRLNEPPYFKITIHTHEKSKELLTIQQIALSPTLSRVWR